MLITFIVLAVIALIFLFVYNTRRLPKRPEKNNEPKGQENEAAEPKLIEPGNNHHPGKIIEIEQHSSSSQSMSDQAYREALRQFSNPNKTTTKEESDSKPEITSDEAYREALRSMAKRVDK